MAKFSVDLKCMFLDFGRRLNKPERTHTDSNPQPPCCRALAQTTAPIHVFYILLIWRFTHCCCHIHQAKPAFRFGYSSLSWFCFLSLLLQGQVLGAGSFMVSSATSDAVIPAVSTVMLFSTTCLCVLTQDPRFFGFLDFYFFSTSHPRRFLSLACCPPGPTPASALTSLLVTALLFCLLPPTELNVQSSPKRL